MQTMANGWGHDNYTSPIITVPQLRLQASPAASRDNIMNIAIGIN